MASPFNAIAKPARHASGMTLIELLTVVFLGALLLSMVFMLYTNSSRSYIRQEAVMEQMLNLRGGLAGISRQIRMAGNGYALLGLNQNQYLQVYLKDADGLPVGWFQYPGDSHFGVKPIYGLDGGSTGTDSVTVCALAPDFATPLGTLSADFSPAQAELRLDNVLEAPSGMDPAEILKPGDYLALVPASGDPVLVESDVDGSDLRRIRLRALPSNLPNGVSSIPSGAAVYNVKTVTLRTFSVDPVNHALLMDSNEVAGDLMAENIEDLQVAYCLGQDDPGEPASYVHTLDGQDLFDRPVKTVRLVMVSRSERPDPYKGTFATITALNHDDTGPADSHIRRFLENTVQLRNY
jgi:type II secretory pathway pseudopilin PulG